MCIYLNLMILIKIIRGFISALHLNVAGGDILLHMHVAQGGLILTPDHSGVQIGSAEPDRHSYHDDASLLVRS